MNNEWDTGLWLDALKFTLWCDLCSIWLSTETQSVPPETHILQRWKAARIEEFLPDGSAAIRAVDLNVRHSNGLLLSHCALYFIPIHHLFCCCSLLVVRRTKHWWWPPLQRQKTKKLNKKVKKKLHFDINSKHHCHQHHNTDFPPLHSPPPPPIHTQSENSIQRAQVQEM